LGVPEFPFVVVVPEFPFVVVVPEFPFVVVVPEFPFVVVVPEFPFVVVVPEFPFVVVVPEFPFAAVNWLVPLDPLGPLLWPSVVVWPDLLRSADPRTEPSLRTIQSPFLVVPLAVSFAVQRAPGP
jgi:hypothetical protein